MGDVAEDPEPQATHALEQVLRAYGVPLTAGGGTGAAQEVYSS